jgi:hypothetical protein
VAVVAAAAATTKTTHITKKKSLNKVVCAEMTSGIKRSG